MKKKTVKNKTDSLALLLLFCIFASCILMVLLTGADTYRRLVSRDEAAYDRRVGLQYIATRVRQADSVNVDLFGDSEALILGDGEYITRVYYYDGYIMELYAQADLPLVPQDGERITAASSLGFSLEDNLLTVDTADISGEESTFMLSLRTKKGVR